MYVQWYLDDVVVAATLEEVQAAMLVVRVLRRAQVRMYLRLDGPLTGPRRPVQYLGQRLVVDYRNLQ